MPVGRHPDGVGYAAPGELERGVERVDALVREEIGSLPCGLEVHHEICGSAAEALGRLKPHLEVALVALSDRAGQGVDGQGALLPTRLQDALLDE